LGSGDFERFEAEAFYGGENIVGGFGPAEGFWIVVDRLDVGLDRPFQLSGGQLIASSDPAGFPALRSLHCSEASAVPFHALSCHNRSSR
jgi:hypothetical protein